MHLDEIIKRKAYEKIIGVVRRHWITYIPTIFLYFILGIIPIVLLTAAYVTDSIPQEIGFRTLLALIICAYELSIALFFYASFLIYYLDMIIITNDRIVEVSQKNLFSRSVSELDLYKIQDSTSDVTGFVATLFDYGTLSLQTAGENENFVFPGVGKPHALRRQIMELAEEDRKYHMGQQTITGNIH